MREHDGNTSTIILENIADIGIIMREHKMQAITDVVLAYISPDNWIGNKLKINSVAVTANLVGYNPHAVALPAMYAIAVLKLWIAGRMNLVICNGAVHSILGIDAKKIIV